MYGGGGGVVGRSTHLESSIPLILIIILAVFIAGNFGIINFSDVPVLKDIFGGKTIKVTVIGRPSPQLVNQLTSKDSREAGIWYAGSGLRQEILTTGTLKSFDVVILQGQPVCDRTARRVISDWVKGGGRLLIIGDACTRVTDDPAALGWDVGGLLGDVVPAKIGGVTHTAEPIRRGCTSGQFRFAEYDHPIGAGIKEFQFSGTTIEVYPTANGRIISYIDCSDTSRASLATTPAILENSGLFGGKVIYLAYDPGIASRNMFINTLKYMKNQKG